MGESDVLIFSDEETYQYDDIEELNVHDIREGKWSNIRDLDDFFVNVYEYSSLGGFKCILVEHIFIVFEKLLIGFIGFSLSMFIDYRYLFYSPNRISWNKVFNFDEPLKLNIVACYFLVTTLITVTSKLFEMFKKLSKVYEMSFFFKEVLKIDSSELVNYHWREIQEKLISAQNDIQMCIYRKKLSELEIHQVILRRENYIIGLHNEGTINYAINFPLIGTRPYLPLHLLMNVKYILFGYGTPIFYSKSKINDDFLVHHKRKKLIKQLRLRILLFAIINLVLLPVLFTHTVIYSAYTYILIYEKNSVGFFKRRWSLYSQIHLRSYNEIDHKFKSRLAKGYCTAIDYLGGFSSPLVTIIARHMLFIFGSSFTIIFGLSIIFPSLYTLPYIVSLASVLVAIMNASHSLVPEENRVYKPKEHYNKLVSYLLYIPTNIGEISHKQETIKFITTLLPFKIEDLISNLMSPFVTPLILAFYLRPRAEKIVEFFMENTTRLKGIGDVCTLSLMQPRNSHDELFIMNNKDNKFTNSCYMKPEISLLQFKRRNRTWRCSSIAYDFIDNIKYNSNKRLQDSLNQKRKSKKAANQYQKQNRKSKKSNRLREVLAENINLIHRIANDESFRRSTTERITESMNKTPLKSFNTGTINLSNSAIP